VRKQSNTTRNSPKKFRRVSLTSIVLAAAILAIAAVTVISRQNAQVQEPTQQERSSPVTKKTNKKLAKVEEAGQEVKLDGETPELTPEEAQKLAAGLKLLIDRSTEGHEQVQNPDGSVSIKLNEKFQNVTVAKVNKDGTITQSCVNNAKAAGAFFGIDSKEIEKETPSRPSQPTPANNRN
jgi:hypothetical protein